MGTQFSENVHQDASGVKLVSVGQNRGPLTGDEWITPMTMWELDETTGVYMPPGESNNPKSPRVRIDPKHIMLDDDGNEVVRIVNVAPWAYDAVDDTLKVKIGDTVSTSEENSQATLNRVMLLASEGKLEQVRALLNTQLANINTEVANVKNKLIAAPATEAKQNTANTSLATIATKTTATEEQLLLVKSELSNVKAELTAIKASLTDGTQKVSTVGNIMALDQDSEESKPLVVVSDGQGGWALKIVESAPAGYDEEKNIIRTHSLEDKLVPIGLVENVTIEPSGENRNVRVFTEGDVDLRQFSSLRWVIRTDAASDFRMLVMSYVDESAYAGGEEVRSYTNKREIGDTFEHFTEGIRLTIQNNDSKDILIRYAKVYGVR